MPKNYFVTISGNIGVGKTTLTKLIADEFGWEPFFERVINNPYLDDFYADMQRWSFNLQVYFLSKRFIDQKSIRNRTESCIQDRSIYEDAEIFAYILHKQGYFDQRDYENYRELFYCMTSYLRQPDLVIYLRASTWTLVTRIRKRGRDYEKNISSEYLHELNLAYERWIKQAKKDMNVLVIETDNVDFEKNEEALQKIYDDIRSHCPK